MINSQTVDRVVIDRDVLPIFVVKMTTPIEPVSFEGTGFILRRGLFITCWHCVAAPLPSDHVYAAVIESSSGGREAAFLSNIERDTNGADLATTNLDRAPTLQLNLPDTDLAYGTDVWSFGYPLTDRGLRPDQGPQFILNGRYLEGYVMRSFYYEHPTYGRTPSYELDMPTPAGLSGAPLVKTRSQEVVGVIYGSNDVATIEQMMLVDPDTGKREPEIQRIISFGLAHYTETLRNLRGTATRGLPLHEFLKR